ncbi:HNH endonuclease [Streptomyces sp. NRRL S-87]|uniref:HNH endonuclease signature motif containing protein n=1 Tax=Streptomyces sp. NRRL S-87 TaxID=1463920 RepID=UPI00068BCDF6|nr:HNH endonuclease [Streptomyces sp. NRRL S-87]
MSGPRKGGRLTKPPTGVLRTAVEASTTLAETLRRLNLPVSGHTHQALKAWIREEGLPTGHFLGQAHQRGKPGPTPRRTAEAVLVRHDNPRRTKTPLLRRALQEMGVPECCAECGTPPEWLGLPMTLEVDHINGDWRDDRMANLRLLCPNCHAQTDTWCGRRRRKAVARGTGAAVD